jgi:hypothetical protein
MAKAGRWPACCAVPKGAATPLTEVKGFHRRRSNDSPENIKTFLQALKPVLFLCLFVAAESRHLLKRKATAPATVRGRHMEINLNCLDDLAPKKIKRSYEFLESLPLLFQPNPQDLRWR